MPALVGALVGVGVGIAIGVGTDNLGAGIGAGAGVPGNRVWRRRRDRKQEQGELTTIPFVPAVAP